MNKNEVYLAVFAALCVLAGVLVGAGISRRPDPGRADFRQKAERLMGYRHNGPGAFRGKGPAEVLTSRLGLDAGQQKKVEAILENTRQEIEKVGKDLRSAIGGIKEKSDKQIMEVLTPQQQEKFKAFQKEFCQGPGGRRLFPGRHGGPGMMGGGEMAPQDQAGPEHGPEGEAAPHSGDELPPQQ